LGQAVVTGKRGGKKRQVLNLSGEMRKKRKNSPQVTKSEERYSKRRGEVEGGILAIPSSRLNKEGKKDRIVGETGTTSPIICPEAGKKKKGKKGMMRSRPRKGKKKGRVDYR